MFRVHKTLCHRRCCASALVLFQDSAQAHLVVQWHWLESTLNICCKLPDFDFSKATMSVGSCHRTGATHNSPSIAASHKIKLKPLNIAQVGNWFRWVENTINVSREAVKKHSFFSVNLWFQVCSPFILITLFPPCLSWWKLHRVCCLLSRCWWYKCWLRCCNSSGFSDAGSLVARVGERVGVAWWMSFQTAAN